MKTEINKRTVKQRSHPHTTVPQWQYGLHQSAAQIRSILQPKLAIGDADDKYEKEADEVAKQVASSPDEHSAQAPATKKISSRPPIFIQAKIDKTIPEDLTKGMQGAFELYFDDITREKLGGMTGYIQFTPSIASTVPDAPKIGLVQTVKVVDDETQQVFNVKDRYTDPTIQQKLANIVTQSGTSDGENIEAGYFVDKKFEEMLSPNISPDQRAAKSPYYIDTRPGVAPGQRNYHTPDKKGSYTDKHGSKAGEKVEAAILTDAPQHTAASTYQFETYAQNDTGNVYGGVGWGFKIKPAINGVPVSAGILPPKIEPSPVVPLAGLSATAKDALTRFEQLQPKLAEENRQTAADSSSFETPNLSDGKPLDDATRSFMESRFSHDFSEVKIHNTTAASRSADSIGARAYTVGSNVFFRQGEYNTNSREGRQLLAHELTHVVQQGGSEALTPKTTAPNISKGNLATPRAQRALNNLGDEDSLLFNRIPWGNPPSTLILPNALMQQIWSATSKGMEDDREYGGWMFHKNKETLWSPEPVRGRGRSFQNNPSLIYARERGTPNSYDLEGAREWDEQNPVLLKYHTHAFPDDITWGHSGGDIQNMLRGDGPNVSVVASPKAVYAFLHTQETTQNNRISISNEVVETNRDTWQSVHDKEIQTNLERGQEHKFYMYWKPWPTGDYLTAKTTIIEEGNDLVLNLAKAPE